MTVVRCPYCHKRYYVWRIVPYGEQFVCKGCGDAFNYGGARVPLKGKLGPVILDDSSRNRGSHFKTRRLPTVLPPAPICEYTFPADYDVRRLEAQMSRYQLRIVPPMPTLTPDQERFFIESGKHVLLVNGVLSSREFAPGQLPDGFTEWGLVAGRWRCLGGGKEIGEDLRRFLASFADRLADLRRRVSRIAVRLTARDLTTDPSVTSGGVDLSLAKGESLLWRGDALYGGPETDGEVSREGSMYLTDRRLIVRGDGVSREYGLEKLRDAVSDWRDRAGVLYLGEREACVADEIWWPSLYIRYLTGSIFRGHFCLNGQAEVVNDLCDSLCNPQSFMDEDNWPTGGFADTLVFKDLFEAQLMPRWRRCQW